jgi:uncharacterized membrane protein
MSEEPSVFKPRPRIQSLSDLIFGLALSIGALTLIGQQPATTQQLWASLALYGFSFLILISVWQLYSSITAILPAESTGLTDLNIALLFLVSIEPYLFNELFAQNGAMFSTVSNIYAFDLAAMFMILAFFNHSLANEEKKLVPKSLIRMYKFRRNFCLLGAAVFMVSIVPFFGLTVLHVNVGGISLADLPFRVILWVVTLPLGWIRRFLERSVIS